MRMRCWRLETETVAEFEKKFLEVVEKLIFEVRLAHDLAGFQPEKLEDVRVANRERRLGGLGQPASMTRVSPCRGKGRFVRSRGWRSAA